MLTAAEIMNRTGFEVLKMIDEVKQQLPQLTKPFYCIHGELDELAMPIGSHMLLEKSGTPQELKSLEIYKVRNVLYGLLSPHYYSGYET